MNAEVFKGKWHQLKGEVKSRWGELTDDDLDVVEGDAEKLIGRVQERMDTRATTPNVKSTNSSKRHPIP
jgi:uncharacterized protein YjbJ (UPF0337 family)